MFTHHNHHGCASVPPALQRLTVREREILVYLVRGRTNKHIALDLGLSPRTIESHRARIYMKLQVRNAVELTRHCLYGRTSGAIAGRMGLISTGSFGGLSVPGSSGPVVMPVLESGRYPPDVSGVSPTMGPGHLGVLRVECWSG